MTKNTVDPIVDSPASDDEWENIQVGLGREWILEDDGVITGIFMGSGSMEVEDKQNGGTRETMYYQFEVDGEIRFIWGSYNIDLGMHEIDPGTLMRITYLGTDTFSGDRGPQQVKSYKFQRKAR